MNEDIKQLIKKARASEQDAHERNRQRKPSPRQEILNATGRPEMPEMKTRSVKELFQQMGGVV